MISQAQQEHTGVCPAGLLQVHEALLKNIKRRMTPQPLKIRADVELTCFAYDGVERIRDAMRAAEAAGNEDCPVRMKLVAPPLYVLTTQTLDKTKGIEVIAGGCWWFGAALGALGRGLPDVPAGQSKHHHRAWPVTEKGGIQCELLQRQPTCT